MIRPTDDVEHTVWDEPALLSGIPGPVPDGQLTYSRWLRQRMDRTSLSFSLLVTLGLILCSGPWGVLGVFISGLSQADLTLAGFLGVILFGPVTEELTKVAVTLWVVEKRPYWFKHAAQMVLCAAAGGLLFAAMENLIYLRVYIPNASPSLARWRWIVCSAMHLTCSTLAGLGLAAVWRSTIRTQTRPNLKRAAPYLIAAMVIHGSYNAVAVLGQITGWLDFGKAAPTVLVGKVGDGRALVPIPKPLAYKPEAQASR